MAGAGVVAGAAAVGTCEMGKKVGVLVGTADVGATVTGPTVDGVTVTGETEEG